MVSGGSSIYDLVIMPIMAYMETQQAPNGNQSFIAEFFPRIDASIMDLDQAVALLAGMTVLGFTLYGAAHAWYKKGEMQK